MGSTTIKLSVATRDRLRSFGGATYEETVIAALDLLDAARFWEQAESAVIVRSELVETTRRRLQAAEAELERALDGVD